MNTVKALGEVDGLNKEIWQVEKKVEEMPYFTRRYFNKMYNERMDKFGDDYTGLLIECQHEVCNACYEDVLKYRSLPLVDRVKLLL